MKLQQLRTKARLMLKIAGSFIPQGLPQSEGAVMQFAEDVIEIGGLPKNDSFLRAICSALMHLSQESSVVSKRRVLLGLRRSILNQSAYNIISDLKKKEAEGGQQLQTPQG